MMQAFSGTIRGAPQATAEAVNDEVDAQNPRPLIGSNSSVVDLGERRALFIEQLTHFAAERRREEALTRQQLAALPPEAQTQSQRQALLDGVAHMYARDPRLDCKVGVFTVITFYSGNRDGACTLSVPRLAKFLSRSERSIQDALQRLEQDQVIIIERRPGSTSLITPWVHRSFGQFRDPLTWIMDVRAPSTPRGRPGRPRLVAGAPVDPEIPPQPASPLFNVEENQWIDGNTPEAGFTPAAGYTPAAGQQIPPRRASPNMKIDMEGEERLVGAAHGFAVADATLDTFAFLVNHWGTKQGAVAFDRFDRVTTDAMLDDALSAVAAQHSMADASTLHAAMVATVNACRAVYLTDSTSAGAPKGTGPRALVNYFQKALSTEVARLLREAANFQAQARADNEVHKARLQKRMSGVEAAASRPTSLHRVSPSTVRYAKPAPEDADA